jgi:hypothetical protein
VTFTKYDRQHQPLNVQRAMRSGALYRLTMFYDDPKNLRYCGHAQIGVILTPWNEVIPLKNNFQRPIIIHHKRGARRVRGERVTKLYQSEWCYHEVILDQAKRSGVTPEQVVTGLFTLVANMYEAAQAGVINVEARAPNKLVANFAVDVRRTPYFFKDRDAVVADAGHTKRIFHIVRTHTRTTKSGQETAVKTHFRGLRSFVWNGFAVNITVPVRDHLAIADLDVGALDAEHNIAEPVLSMEETGAMLVRVKAEGLKAKNIMLH